MWVLEDRVASRADTYDAFRYTHIHKEQLLRLFEGGWEHPHYPYVYVSFFWALRWGRFWSYRIFFGLFSKISRRNERICEWFVSMNFDNCFISKLKLVFPQCQLPVQNCWFSAKQYNHKLLHVCIVFLIAHQLKWRHIFNISQLSTSIQNYIYFLRFAWTKVPSFLCLVVQLSTSTTWNIARETTNWDVLPSQCTNFFDKSLPKHTSASHFFSLSPLAPHALNLIAFKQDRLAAHSIFNARVSTSLIDKMASATKIRRK